MSKILTMEQVDKKIRLIGHELRTPAGIEELRQIRDSHEALRSLCDALLQGATAQKVAAAKDGASLISAERLRQVKSEGWTAEHDTLHCRGELANAAVAYIHCAHSQAGFYAPIHWPWEPKWWKWSPDPIKNLVKAGALIAAEIDRLSAAPLPSPPHEPVVVKNYKESK